MPWRAPRATLRRRLAVTLGALSASVLLVLGLVYGSSEHFIERAALRSEMEEELRALLSHESRGEHVPLVSAALRYYPADAVPSELRELPADTFRRMRFAGKSVQVLTAAEESGAVHVLVQDLTLMQQRERWLVFSLIAGVCLASAGAWWASGRLARRILRPLAELVARIQRIDPFEPGRHPVSRTGDVDVDVIPDAVNALIGRLDHVLQRERAFADAASHELRTPLAVVRGAVDLIRERGDSTPQIVDRLDRAARRAQEDLEALLALSPAREPAAARKVNLKVLLPEAAEPYLRESAAATRIVWNWSDSCEALVEPAALAIIFTNLLRNAMRAAPNGVVNVRSDARSIQITDDGEGLPLGWPDHRDVRGRGLGLLIARTLAERHRWRIEFEAGQPQGTRATLWFV